MAENTVKRCVRPQCMEIYSQDVKNKYCDCGALLQLTELEMNPKRVDKQPVKETIPKAKPDAFLYLMLDDGDVEFALGENTIIGKTSENNIADIDLKEYGGKDISRRHALISRETDGCYITNLSQNHSVHVNQKALPYGMKVKLKSMDGIILSRKFLLQFEEGE